MTVISGSCAEQLAALHLARLGHWNGTKYFINKMFGWAYSRTGPTSNHGYRPAFLHFGRLDSTCYTQQNYGTRRNLPQNFELPSGLQIFKKNEKINRLSVVTVHLEANRATQTNQCKRLVHEISPRRRSTCSASIARHGLVIRAVVL